MKRHLLLLAGALALLASSAPAQEPAAPEAPEPLRVLQEALNRRGSYAANGFILRFEAKDFRACKIMYELSPQVPPGHTGFVPFAERTTVDLSAVDAARVQVVTGRRGATITFAARGDAPAIERRLGESPHTFGEPSRLTSAYLFLPGKQAAEEVRTALVRAIESCAK